LIRRRALAGLGGWLLLVAACTAAELAPPTVILISLDGTRPEDARALPALAEIARRGIAPVPMRPVFPTNTFPNHVSLVTGVSPVTHGIVNNTFRDPERGRFRYESDPTWIEVEPLWSLLAAEGIRSAAFHWVGSEGEWRSGRGPAEWRAFDASVPEAKKVEQILAWLDGAPPTRPQFITTWFRGTDAAAHRAGPNSAAARERLAQQGVALQALLDGIGARGLWAQTTLILVSDHGMTEVDRTVDLAAALEQAGLRAWIYGGGGFATLWTARGESDVERALRLARSLGLEAWRPGTRPGGPADHPRFGEVVVMAPLGLGIVSRAGLTNGKRELRGSHGYSPDAPSMQAFFAAIGRGVEPGYAPAHAPIELGNPSGAPDHGSPEAGSPDAGSLDSPQSPRWGAGDPGGVRVLDIAPTVLRLFGHEPAPWMEGRALDLESSGATR